MVERYRPKRFSAQLSRRTGTQQQKGYFRRDLPSEVLKRQQQAEAKEYDRIFIETQFTNINQIEPELNKVPSGVRRYMTYDVDIAKTDWKNRINNIESAITQSQDNLRRYRKKDDRAREDREEAKIKGYGEGLTELRSGELLSVTSIRKYASDLGSRAYDIQKGKEKRKEARKVKPITGTITKINYEKGYAIIGGRQVRLTKQGLKNVELTSVTKAKERQAAEIKKQQDVLRQAQAGKVEIIFTNTKTGITTRDIVDINVTAKAEAKKILAKREKEVKKITPLQRISELEKKSGLQPRIIDISTGKVIQEGRFKLDRKAQNQISRINKQLRFEEKRKAEVKLAGALTEKNLRKSLENTFGKTFTSLIRTDRLAQLNGLFSSEEKEQERKSLEKFLLISVPRELSAQAQVISLNNAIIKQLNRNFDREVNTLNISPKTKKLSSYREFENKLRKEFLRIQSKPVNKRTTKEMALIGIFGIGSAALGTLRKIPVATWNFIVTILRPDLIVAGLYNLATDAGMRSNVNSQIKQFSKKLQKGDPDAVSTLVSEIMGYKAGNKIILESAKVASISPLIRRAQEARLVLSLPLEMRPYVREILKAARVQEKLRPVNLKGINKINFNEVLELNKVEAAALKKTLQETDSFIFGSLAARTLAKGKTKLPKDVDLATKNPKTFFNKFIDNLPKNKRNLYKVKGESLRKGNIKLLDVKGYDRLRPDQTLFGTGRLPINTVIYKTNKPKLKQAGLKIPTQKLVEIEGIKLIGFGEQTTRKALGTLQVILEKTGRRAKDPAAFIESLEIQLAALKGKIPKTKYVTKYLLKRKARTLEAAIKLLKSKSFEKILNNKVPGLTKEYPILTKIFKLSKKAKAKIRKNVKEKIKNIQAKLKPIKKKVMPKKKVIKKKKLIKKKPVIKKKKIVKKVKRVIKKKPSIIPKIKKPSKLPVAKKPSKLPVTKKPSKLPPTKKPSKMPFSKTPKSKLPSQLRNIKTASIMPVSNIPPSKIPSTITTSKIPPSKLPSIIAASKIPPSKLPSIIPVGSGIVDPIKEKIIRIILKDIEKDIPSDLIVKYVGTYRERRLRSKPFNKRTNKIITKTISMITTRNRALKKVAELADRRTVRSIELSVTGFTIKKMKDIKLPTILKKFTKKKSIGTPVLKLVEKTKFIADKPGEIRELLAKKKQKAAAKKKVTKKSTSKRVSTKSKVKKKKKIAKKPSKKKSSKKITKKTKKKKKK